VSTGSSRRKPRRRRHGRPLERTSVRRGRSGRQFVGRLGVLAGTLVLLAAVGLFVRAALAGISGRASFTVREVRVEGTRYLEPAELLALARPESLLAGQIGAAELELLGEHIAAHPLVERVAVRRSLPAAVVVAVTERVPVAFLAGRPLAGVDLDGRVLPEIEPSRYGALPFITGLPEAEELRSEALGRSVRLLRALEEKAPRLLDTVSEVRAGPDAEMMLILSNDAVTVRLSQATLPGVLPLVNALVEEGRRRHAPLAEVDLRFAGTVIYRERKGGG